MMMWRGAVFINVLRFLVCLLLVCTYAYAGERRYTVPLDGSPFCGAKNAPVTIIEFLDYQ